MKSAGVPTNTYPIPYIFIQVKCRSKSRILVVTIVQYYGTTLKKKTF